MVWEASTNLNANPFRGIVRSTGFWSLRFLCLTLAITPVRWLTGRHWLVKFRRMMGLFSFFYSTVHTVTSILSHRVARLDAPIRTRPLTTTAHTMSSTGAALLRPFFPVGLV